MEKRSKRTKHTKRKEKVLRNAFTTWLFLKKGLLYGVAEGKINPKDYEKEFKKSIDRFPYHILDFDEDTFGIYNFHNLEDGHAKKCLKKVIIKISEDGNYVKSAADINWESLREITFDLHNKEKILDKLEKYFLECITHPYKVGYTKKWLKEQKGKFDPLFRKWFAEEVVKYGGKKKVKSRKKRKRTRRKKF